MNSQGKRVLAARQVVGNVIAGYDHLHNLAELKKAYAQAMLNVQEELEYEPYVPYTPDVEPH
jgi:hypothetical protein